MYREENYYAFYDLTELEKDYKTVALIKATMCKIVNYICSWLLSGKYLPGITTLMYGFRYKTHINTH
jgi:hypothetical protein